MEEMKFRIACMSDEGACERVIETAKAMGGFGIKKSSEKTYDVKGEFEDSVDGQQWGFAFLRKRKDDVVTMEILV